MIVAPPALTGSLRDTESVAPPALTGSLRDTEFELDGVCARYGHREVLHGLDLDLPSGKATALLGENGSGKSTLLRVLAGLQEPSAGSVSLNGRPLASLAPARRACEIGYLPQSFEPFFPATALEVVLLGRTPHRGLFGRVLARDVELAREALATVDALDFELTDISAMSGGERQRVLLARVLAGEPRVLLLDEPTKNLDPRHRLLVADVMRRHVARGGAVVFSTHEMDVATVAADELVFLKAGRLMDRGPRDSMLTAPKLSSLFGVPAEVVPGPGGDPLVFLGLGSGRA